MAKQQKLVPQDDLEVKLPTCYSGVISEEQSNWHHQNKKCNGTDSGIAALLEQLSRHTKEIKKLCSASKHATHPILPDREGIETAQEVNINNATSQEKNENDDSSSMFLYYGVALLAGSSCSEEDEPPLVYTDKKEALRAAKKYKGARFKAFASREEAVAFAVSSPEQVFPFLGNQVLLVSEPDSATVTGEKASPHKAPRSKEMVKLRKAIECGDAEYFNQTVWSNPRYLISSGDTPAVMQEGFRYNGLHVAAKSKQAGMCRLILDTIENPAFMELLYKDDSETIRKQRVHFLTDLYLNMPEKGLCETPLHFASKFGCVKAVEMLVMHPACNKKQKNKYGQTPEEIICDRCTVANAELKSQMQALFEDQYFVPILRSEDNSIQAVVGEPVSPAKTIQLAGSSSPPGSPKESLLEIKALAGPMSPTQAELFFKKWKTSPSPLRSTQDLRNFHRVRLIDTDKGLERIGRSLAQSFKVRWTEYWSFLNCWCDLVSAEGITKLESHLQKMYTQVLVETRNNLLLDGTCEDSSDAIWSPEKLPLQKPSRKGTPSELEISPISDLCARLQSFHLGSRVPTTSPDMPSVLERLANKSLDDEVHSDTSSNSSISDVQHKLNFNSSSDDESTEWIHRNINGTAWEDERQKKTDHRGGALQVISDRNSMNDDFSGCSPHIIQSCGMLTLSLVRFVDNLLQLIPEIVDQVVLDRVIGDRLIPEVIALQSSAYNASLQLCHLNTVHFLVARAACKNILPTILPQEAKSLCTILNSCLSVSSDHLSSDEEEQPYEWRCVIAKPPARKFSKNGHLHLKCILNHLCDFLSRKLSLDTDNTAACSCLWHTNSSSLQTDHLGNASCFVEAKLDSGALQEINRRPENLAGTGTCQVGQEQLDEVDRDEEETFFTPPSSLHSSCSTPSEVFTPDDILDVFMQGINPSKLDLDVYRALDSIEVDPILYPHTYRWKQLMTTFPQDAMDRLFSPTRSAARKSGFHQNPPSPISQSTPVHVRDKLHEHWMSPIQNKVENCQPRNLYDSFLGWEESSGD